MALIRPFDKGKRNESGYTLRTTRVYSIWINLRQQRSEAKVDISGWLSIRSTSFMNTSLGQWIESLMTKEQLTKFKESKQTFSQVTGLIEHTETNDSNYQERKFISQIRFLINIYRGDSLKNHQRALRSLDQITHNRDQVWNNTRKMLLMSNFELKGFLVDFFATLSPDGRDRAFVDFYKLYNLEQKAALDAMCAVPYGTFVLHGCGGSEKTWLCMDIISRYSCSKKS